MTRRALGEVRPSQIITTFGPGAIADLQTVSVIVGGIDNWPTEAGYEIHEPRLERALRGRRVFSAKPSQGSFFDRVGTVPCHLFPRYQVCPVSNCRTLSVLGDGDVEYDSRWREVRCKAPGCPGRSSGRFRAATLPAPFVVACPGGHIDEFPWRVYAHRGVTTCRSRMKLYSVGRTGSVADLVIECSCGNGTRSAGDAFGENRAQVLGACTRRRPWLGLRHRDQTTCTFSDQVRAMQRGATNAWFPVVRSALAVRERATPIGVALNSCNAGQVETIDSVERLRQLVALEMFPSLVPFRIEDVWQAIRKLRGEAETDDADLRWPEWTAFRVPEEAGNDLGEFFLQDGEVPSTRRGLLSRVVLARKLLEVRALVAFSRIDSTPGTTDGAPDPHLSPIYGDRPDWLPAVEVRGAGVLVELNEGAVAAWESQDALVALARAMSRKFAEWEAERKTPPSPFPGARYVLLHSLAHALIRQVALDCGYSASAIRERIYSGVTAGRRMAGLLLYTASPDSEGSLGGLVDLGAPHRFPGVFSSALASANRCSSDPLCADHQPDLHATINAAACHACLLISETSCEGFNRFLDRNTLTQTIAQRGLAFFPSAPNVAMP